jgi:hypothetical protein
VVENVFRGSTVDGVLEVIVREDVAVDFDVDAKVYHFTVHLTPGKSQTFSESFEPYKGGSTRGFFLKVKWGNSVLAEQESRYPPRLSVIEGTLSLVDVYWTVGGSRVTNCKFGDEVVAHVVLKASDAPVEDTIKIKIRKDLMLLPDEDVSVMTLNVFLEKDELKEFTSSFIPSEPSGGSLRGYFVEVEGDLSWTMPDTYPPRLRVGTGGTPSVVDAWWTSYAGTVTEVKKGEAVQAHVRIEASGGDLQGTVTIRVRKDLPYLPDEDYVTQTYTISLKENEKTDLTIAFIASESTSPSFRGYFVQVDFVTWSTSWTMESSYPPRLKVVEEISEEGTPSLQNVWWTVNEQIVTEAKQGQTVKAHIQVRAVGGNVKGTLTIHIRKDLALLPDEDYKAESFNIDLPENQIIELVVTFSAAEKSGLSFRGYFVQVDFDSWGTTWTMESSYPPRLKVT